LFFLQTALSKKLLQKSLRSFGKKGENNQKALKKGINFFIYFKERKTFFAFS